MITGQTNQKGMTLLELIAAMAIGAIIMMGIVALIFQEFKGTATANNSVTAAHEIGNAARWISQDGMMAQSTDLVEGAELSDNLTLTWAERQDFVDIPHSSCYSLSGTQLQRDYDGVVTTVARDISKIEFSQTGRVLTVSIDCTPPWGATEGMVQKTYRIYLRPAEGDWEW